jgi:hypothetical protein
MTLVIDEFPAPLMQLLYVRHAWGLDSWIHIPDLDPEPDSGGSALPEGLSGQVAEGRWDAAWKHNLYWLLRPQGDYQNEFDVAARFGITGPLWWFREYSVDGVDVPAFEAWMRHLEELKTTHQFNSPERVAVAEAAAAWAKGLRTIYVMPYEKHMGAEWNGEHIMTVDAGTRLDPELYPTAFASQPV